jgi:hypothetical protein
VHGLSTNCLSVLTTWQLSHLSPGLSHLSPGLSHREQVIFPRVSDKTERQDRKPHSPKTEAAVFIPKVKVLWDTLLKKYLVMEYFSGRLNTKTDPESKD